MALNDWADRDVDRRARPDRPIPSGRISPAGALGVALALLASGPLLAFGVSRDSALILACVALAAVVYDLHGRGAWRGPILLAACRAGNLSAGFAYGWAVRDPSLELSAVEDRRAFAVVLAAYALYVFLVSRLGRLEDVDREDDLGRGPAIYLGGAAFALLVPAALSMTRVLRAEFASSRETGAVAAGAVFIGVWGAAPLFLRAVRTREWRKLDVLRAMGFALRRLMVFTAGTALLAGGGGCIVAVAIVCGYPLSYFLRGVFPPS
jgi:4-hydroxybenzoate polyprenyltransferase